MIRHDGLSADRAPGAMETAIARRLVLLSIPASAKEQKNPNASNDDAWRGAMDHFAEHCAGCHGPDGRGRSEFGAHMYPPVPDLADPAIQAFSDGALFWIIQRGVRWTGMPAFQADHTADETWRLVSFVRQVPRRPAADPDHRAENKSAHGDQRHTVAMDGLRATRADGEKWGHDYMDQQGSISPQRFVHVRPPPLGRLGSGWAMAIPRDYPRNLFICLYAAPWNERTTDRHQVTR